MARLLLGPLLRHVGERDATIWVETDSPCSVQVSAGNASGHEPTFTVAGHHYAIGRRGRPRARPRRRPTRSSSTASGSGRRRLDVSAEPDPDDRPGPAHPPAVRLVPRGPGPLRRSGGGDGDPDVLDAFANRMLGPGPRAMAGTPPSGRRPGLRRRHLARDAGVHEDTARHPAARRQARSPTSRSTPASTTSRGANPAIRWLLSTLPSSMIFDDHDVRDDWNTSARLAARHAEDAWWEERITGALMSYWIYQHLGNLSPAGLAPNETTRPSATLPDGGGGPSGLRPGGRPRGRRRQGNDVVVSARLRAGASARHRLPLRPDPGRRTADR